MRLVLVKWVDSHVGRGWRPMEELQQTTEPLNCKSVGWVVAENKNCIIIAPHIGGEGQGDAMLQACGDITIPCCAIMEMMVLLE